MRGWCCSDVYCPRGNLRKLLDLATQFYQLAWIDGGSQGSHMVLYESQPFSLQLKRGTTFTEARSKAIEVVAFLKHVLELQVASIKSLSIPGAKRQCAY